VFFGKKYKECLEKAKNDFLFRKNAFEACFQTSAFLFALLEYQSSPVEFGISIKPSRIWNINQAQSKGVKWISR
jgi:hypothetical protein